MRKLMGADLVREKNGNVVCAESMFVEGVDNLTGFVFRGDDGIY
jgi:hypothetical protein